jgi:ubiquinone/menaquinone biosynthesis C-methylase UbiE
MNTTDDTEKLIEEMSRYYNARAPWHDYYMSYVSNESMEELLHPIVGIVAPIAVGKRVLEIACGTGNWTQVLAKRSASVTAMDVSPTALEIAKAKLLSYDNVSLKEADAYDLSCIDGSFDLLFSADWWSHIPKQSLPGFLDSAMGKLAPGSSVAFLDMSMRAFFRNEQCYHDEFDNRVSIRTLPDGSEHRVVKNFPSESEIRDLLTRYGSNVVYYEFQALERWMVVFRRK